MQCPWRPAFWLLLVVLCTTILAVSSPANREAGDVALQATPPARGVLSSKRSSYTDLAGRLVGELVCECPECPGPLCPPSKMYPTVEDLPPWCCFVDLVPELSAKLSHEECTFRCQTTFESKPLPLPEPSNRRSLPAPPPLPPPSEYPPSPPPPQFPGYPNATGIEPCMFGCTGKITMLGVPPQPSPPMPPPAPPCAPECICPTCPEAAPNQTVCERRCEPQLYDPIHPRPMDPAPDARVAPAWHYAYCMVGCMGQWPPLYPHENQAGVTRSIATRRQEEQVQ